MQHECPVTSIKINADLNAARNIAKKASYNTPIPSEDTQLHSNKQWRKTINPQRGGNNQDPPRLTLPPRGREGVIPGLITGEEHA